VALEGHHGRECHCSTLRGRAGAGSDFPGVLSCGLGLLAPTPSGAGLYPLLYRLLLPAVRALLVQ
jgi:hypothetical protein